MAYLWKTPATAGATQALFRIPRDLSENACDAALAAAEVLAIQRSHRDGYDPAITRADVERAFREYGCPLNTD